MGSTGCNAVARILCCCLAAVIMLLSVGGCSSLKVVETWSKPAAQGHRYQKILILGIARDENIRKMFEDIVVAELRRNQVNAVAGYTIIPELNPDKTTRAEVVAVVRTSGCDAVLTTRPLSVGDSSVTQQGQGGYVYGANPMASHYGFLQARLQTILYDSVTEEVVWSSTVKTADADNKARVSRDLGRFFFESLRLNGMI
jgi:co-chaperonin GroES (HSP10)